MNLIEIGQKYATDKAEHGFLSHYQSRWGHLRHEPITLLEIGTWDGRSMKTWREYFAQATVVGMDSHPQWEPKEGDNIVFYKGDQENKEDLLRVCTQGPFDIIIDDGGHLPSNHIASFAHLWSWVKPGGWYAIEDCFTLFNECWTKPDDRTILDVINEDWIQPVLCGASDMVEIQIVGGGLNDGLIFFRKRS